MLVLAVEDDQMSRIVYEAIARYSGFEILTVASAEQAVGASRLFHFDAVLMDCNLPGLDGLECTRQLRELHTFQEKYVPIIAITAQVGYRETCLMAGMDDYLSKPFRVDDIRKVLEKWCHENKLVSFQGHENNI